jgi:hypothetical protein
MPIPLSCTCGRAFNIKDECAGRKIRCPECKSVLTVPQPKKKAEPEEILLEVVEEDEPEEIELEVIEEEEEELEEVLPAEPQSRRSAIQSAPAKRPARLSSSEDDERIQATRPRDEDEDHPRPKRRRPKLRREEARGPEIAFEKGWFGSINSGIAGGLLMMFIAVVWFFGGLMVNVLFWYPPVLFVIGIIAVIKGIVDAASG